MAEQHLIRETVTDAQDGIRLDAALAALSRTALTRSRITEYGDDFTINGKPAKPSSRVHSGNQISCKLTIPQPFTEFQPEDLPLEIVYEDRELLVINKTQGMPVHPSYGHSSGTLVNALLYRYKGLPGDDVRPGIVHRLDKDTSGLIVCAKNDAALLSLSAAFKCRQVTKKYTAIVKNRPSPAKGMIDAPLGRDPKNRKKQAVRSGSGSREARTGYRTLKFFPRNALVQLDLYTGRTHQIRVHLLHIGCPILGDPLYSRNRTPGTTLCLAATELSFPHPLSGETLSFSIPLPEHMKRVLARLEHESS